METSTCYQNWLSHISAQNNWCFSEGWQIHRNGSHLIEIDCNISYNVSHMKWVIASHLPSLLDQSRPPSVLCSILPHHYTLSNSSFPPATHFLFALDNTLISPQQMHSPSCQSVSGIICWIEYKCVIWLNLWDEAKLTRKGHDSALYGKHFKPICYCETNSSTWNSITEFFPQSTIYSFQIHFYFELK